MGAHSLGPKEIKNSIITLSIPKRLEDACANLLKMKKKSAHLRFLC